MIFADKTAYTELKEFLDKNNVESYNIRINLLRYTRKGPEFNVMVSEATDEDDIITINDINFIVEKKLLQDYGGFIIVTNEENNGQGVALLPVVQAASNYEVVGCSRGGCGNEGCGGCTREKGSKTGCSGCH